MNAAFRRARWGNAYDEESGKYFEFRETKITVMVAWPPRAWEKSKQIPSWRHVRPEISLAAGDLKKRIRLDQINADPNGQLLLSFQGEHVGKERNPELAWWRWCLHIPDDVRRIVRQFSRRQWHMLSFIARCGDAAFDLTRSNPGLTFALASNWVFHKPPVARPLRSARSLLRRNRKQKDILRWLGFPATEAARKILRKIVYPSIDISPLLNLRRGLEDSGVVKSLGHLSSINTGVLRIVADPELRLLASPALLQEVSEHKTDNRRAASAFLLKDTLQMLRMVDPGQNRLPVIRSRAHLQELHDSLVEDVNRLRLKNLNISWPMAPIEGTHDIVPLRSAGEVVEEGRQQRNCVASYLDRIAVEQRVFVYRVLAPERATLSLVKRGRKWALGELALSRNRPPSPRTQLAVSKWFSSAQYVPDDEWIPF